jgi:glycosyltransferase involved in cell wall biosynthesis
MSRAYDSGGHTRVVERWIERSPEGTKQSLLITRGGKATKRLEQAVSSRAGIVHRLGTFKSPIRKAKLIREISAKYKTVVLHVHMDDILPLLAFGGCEAKPEIIHFNHADHRFWVGSTLPSLVLELRSWGGELSRNHRGIMKSKIVGIPVDPTVSSLGFEPNCRTLAREALGLPVDAKILLTSGHSRKYIRTSKQSFPKAVRSLLQKRQDRLLVCVGPKIRNNSDWQDLLRDFPSQVVFVPIVGHDRFMKYIEAADLGLDSFPMSGGTVVLEMLSNGLPVISMTCPTGHLDHTINSEWYFSTYGDWLTAADWLLDQPREELQKRVLELNIGIRRYVMSSKWPDFPTPKQEALADLRHDEARDEASVVDKILLDEYLVLATPWQGRFLF